jgi:hypothetical protein
MGDWEPGDPIGRLGDVFNLFVKDDTFNLDELAEIILDYIETMEGAQAKVLQTAVYVAGLGFGLNPEEKRNKFIVKKMKEIYDKLKPDGVYTGDIEKITYSELCEILSTTQSKLLEAISKKIIEIIEITKTDPDSYIPSEIPSEDENELSGFFPLIFYLLWAIKGGKIYSEHRGGGKSKRRKRSRKRNSKRSKRRSKTKYKKKTRRSKKKY